MKPLPTGALLTFHGGDLPGFHTQVSFMPQDHIGVIVFEIGNHSQPLYNIVSYNVYERLLGMDQTPWSERKLAIRLKKKRRAPKRDKGARGRVPDTKPSHALPITPALTRTLLMASMNNRTQRQPASVRFS